MKQSVAFYDGEETHTKQPLLYPSDIPFQFVQNIVSFLLFVHFLRPNVIGFLSTRMHQPLPSLDLSYGTYLYIRFIFNII